MVYLSRLLPFFAFFLYLFFLTFLLRMRDEMHNVLTYFTDSYVIAEFNIYFFSLSILNLPSSQTSLQSY
jgi:hypothetical protein